MLTRKLLRGFGFVVVFLAMISAPNQGAVAGEEKEGAEKVSEEQPTTPQKLRHRKWRMRLFGAFAGDSGGTLVTTGSSYAGVAVSGDGGVGVNFEYRYSPRMGFEIGAMAMGGNVRVGVGSEFRRYGASVEVDGYVPITFALNYHPVKGSEIVDFYVGPLLASTFFSSVGVGPGAVVDSRVDLGLGANLGLDINFGERSRWSFNSGLKYISNVTDSGDPDTRMDFDRLILGFGFGFKF
jgi:outer membrane protein W